MADIRLVSDSDKLELGGRDGGDLNLYHNSTNSFIENETGILYVTNKANTSLILGTNNTTAVTIDNSQNVTIAGNATVSDRVVGSSDLILVTTDSNEKIHMDSDGYIKFETAGGERMRIDSSGNVGVGTVINDFTPTLGVTGAQPGLVLNDSATEAFLVAYCDGDASVMMYDHNDSFIIKQAESVGGSGASDALKLDSAKDATFASRVYIADGSASYPAYSFSGDTNTGIYRAGSDNIGFAVNGTSEMTIGSTIDMYNPVAMNNNRIGLGKGAVGTPSLTFQTDGDDAADYDTGMWSPGSNLIAFSTAGSERVRIDGNGNVGIGTDGPPTNLSLYKSSGDNDLMMWSNVHNNPPRLTFRAQDGSAGALDNGDGMGMIYWSSYDGSDWSQEGAMIAVQASADHSGDNCASHMIFHVNSGQRLDSLAMNIKSDLEIDGNFNDTSDATLKEDIKDMPNMADVVNNFKPSTFKWKESTGRITGKRYGFIAQEIEEVVPELVSGEEGSKTLSTIGIVAILAKAVQELSAENNDLKSRIEALENK